jgi:hypothetical protein
MTAVSIADSEEFRSQIQKRGQAKNAAGETGGASNPFQDPSAKKG